MPGVQEARSFGRLFSTTGVRGSAVLQGRSSEVSCSDGQGVLRGSRVSEASCAGGWEFLRLVVLQGRSSGVQEVTGRSSQVQESGRSRSSSSSLRASKGQDESDASSSEGEVGWESSRRMDDDSSLGHIL